jgi:hypothetical protein
MGSYCRSAKIQSCSPAPALDACKKEHDIGNMLAKYSCRTHSPPPDHTKIDMSIFDAIPE